MRSAKAPEHILLFMFCYTNIAGPKSLFRQKEAHNSGATGVFSLTLNVSSVIVVRYSKMLPVLVQCLY